MSTNSDADPRDQIDHLRRRVSDLEAALASRGNGAVSAADVDVATLRAMYDHAVIGFYRTTPDGRIVFANDALVRLLGYDTADQLQSRDLEAPGFEPNYSRSSFKDLIERDGHIVGLEATWHRRDGRAVLVRETCRAVRDRGGRCVFYDGSVEDLSERRRFEDALRESEGWRRDLAESIPDTIIEADRSGRILLINRPLPGQTRGSLLGANVFDFLPGDDSPTVRAALATVFEHGDIARFNTPGPGLPGESRFYEVCVGPHYVGDRVGSAILLARDVTARVEAEARLRDSEALLRSLVEQAGDGFMLVDLSGRVLDVNSASCRDLGYRRGELLGMQVFTFDIDTTPELFASRFQALLNGPPATFETWYRRKDGTEFPVEVTASVVITLGEPRAIALVRDISERKRREQERASLQEQLVHAQRLESIGRLAGGVAHDFNNMLSVILGHTEILLDQTGTADTRREDLLEIRQAAQRSSRLTQQLLAFARRQPVVPKVLDLNELLHELLGTLHRLVGDRIEVTLDAGTSVPQIRIDPGQFDQILANLLLNSRDAIDGTGTVVISTKRATLDDAYCAAHPGTAPGEYAAILVTDSGCGMDADTLARIFEPFFTTKPIGKGSGLGLATVYGIVRQNGGSIVAASTPGDGTAFTIYLPTYRGEAGDGAPPVGAMRPRGSEHVLIVEDEPSLLVLAARVLRRSGYTVFTAGSPTDALRIAVSESGQIDLLVTDMMMPAMNGRDLARRLQRSIPGLKCLYTSGYANELATPEDTDAEQLEFLAKPWNPISLSAKVRQVLDRK